jgi:hypothetical protein
VAVKRKKRPRDPIQLAKLIADIATGQVEDAEQDERDPSAVGLGRKGGLKGGKVRAAKLSKKERTEIAMKAAAARWGRDQETASHSALTALSSRKVGGRAPKIRTRKK